MTCSEWRRAPRKPPVKSATSPQVLRSYPTHTRTSRSICNTDLSEDPRHNVYTGTYSILAPTKPMEVPQVFYVCRDPVSSLEMKTALYKLC